MIRLLLVLAVAMFVFASYSYADQLEEAGAQVELGADVSAGVFCKVESKEVCVLAKTAEDCEKLRGKKVDSCPLPKEQ